MRIGRLIQAVMDASRLTPGGASSASVLLALLMSATLMGQTPSMTPGQNYNQDLDPVLKSIEGLTIHDQLGNPLPLDQIIRRESGEQTTLGKVFESGRPVILNPVYFSCPMLCNLVVEGLVESVAQCGLEIGIDFDVITLSIDPRDSSRDARNRESLLVEALEESAVLAGSDVSNARDGWHFLTGQEPSLRAIADSVGFEYRWNDFNNEYAHGAGIFIVSPDAMLTQTIKGIEYDPQTLRLALVEASDGKVGNWLDDFVLTCFVYDPTIAQYGPAALKVMRLGGILAVLGLGVFLIRLWRRGPQGEETDSPSDPRREQLQS